MKKVSIIVFLLAVMAGFTMSCGEDCLYDDAGFSPCYVACGPAYDSDCVSNCVGVYYCADWDYYCAGDFLDPWGYCD